MGVEDRFPRCSGSDIPHNKHGIFAGISGDYDIEFSIIGGGGDLVALGKRVVVFVGCFRSRR